MKLKFIKAEDLDRNAKGTVHTSGKLGFSSDAMSLLGLDEKKFIAFATNEEDKTDENLYAVVYGSAQEGAFKINKAGEYFYVNTKSMFEALGIDYKNVKIIYDIIKTEYEGEPLFKMLKREIKKKKKDMPT